MEVNIFCQYYQYSMAFRITCRLVLLHAPSWLQKGPLVREDSKIRFPEDSPFLLVLLSSQGVESSIIRSRDVQFVDASASSWHLNAWVVLNFMGIFNGCLWFP